MPRWPLSEKRPATTIPGATSLSALNRLVQQQHISDRSRLQCDSNTAPCSSFAQTSSTVLSCQKRARERSGSGGNFRSTSVGLTPAHHSAPKTSLSRSVPAPPFFYATQVGVPAHPIFGPALLHFPLPLRSHTKTNSDMTMTCDLIGLQL